MGLKSALIAGVATLAIGGTVAVNWNGGDIIKDAQDLISGQNNELQKYKESQAQLVAQIKEATQSIKALKADIADKNQEISELKNGGSESQAKLLAFQDQVNELTAELETKSEELKAKEDELAEMKINGTDVASADDESNINAIEAEINRLRGEVEAANYQADELAQTMNEANMNYQFDPTEINKAVEALNEAIETGVEPAAPDRTESEKEPVVEGTPFLMYTGTPVKLNNKKLIIDREDADGAKNSTNPEDYSLVVTNTDADDWTITLDGNSFTLSGGSNKNLGKLSDLAGKLLTVQQGGFSAKYTLFNQ